MSKVVALMSMSLDGYVADRNDGVAEVFDWYMSSGDVEIHTGGSDPMTFRVSEPSAGHIRGLWAELGIKIAAHREPFACPGGFRGKASSSQSGIKTPDCEYEVFFQFRAG